LVIVGLIAGGVLLGQDLINASKVKSQISQFQEYQTALMTFKGKYDCLPGDCPNASNYNLGANGNGNEILEANTTSFGSITTPDSNAFDGELPLFFTHLGAAGLIKGIFNGTLQLGVGYPKLAINDNYGMIAAGQWQTGATGTTPIQLTSNNNFPFGIFLFAQMCGGALNTAGGAIPSVANDGCGVITPVQAYNIDKKLDDSKPLSGKVWGYSSGSVTGCAVNPYTTYNLQGNTTSCQLSYQMY